MWSSSSSFCKAVSARHFLITCCLRIPNSCFWPSPWLCHQTHPSHLTFPTSPSQLLYLQESGSTNPRSAWPAAQCCSNLPHTFDGHFQLLFQLRASQQNQTAMITPLRALGFGDELSLGESSCNHWMNKTFQLGSPPVPLLLGAVALLNTTWDLWLLLQAFLQLHSNNEIIGVALAH